MIQVSLTQLIIIYLCASVAVVGLIWAGADLLRKRRERRARRFKIVCTICGVDYEDDSGESLTKCPACGSLNERTRIRDI